MAKRELHQIWPLFLLLALMVLQMQLSYQLALTRLALPDPPHEAVQKPEPELFRFFSFGHLPSAIDSLTLRFTLDPTTSKVKPGERASSYYDLDLATDLDPAYYSLYFHGSNFLAIVCDDRRSALDLLLKAENYRKNELSHQPASFVKKYWDQRWAIPVTLAYVYLFELEDLENAAYSFVEASQIPGAPPYLASLAERLRLRTGVYDVGLRLLNFMALSTQEENTRKALMEKRQHLYLNQYLFQVNEAFRTYLLEQTHREAITRPLLSKELERHWAKFRTGYQVLEVDFLGGKIYLDEQGKVQTTTPRRRILGLE